MEVAEDTYDTRDLGRVVWSIEYLQDEPKRERYLAEDSKFVSQINIRSKDQQRLVPVLKVSWFLLLVYRYLSCITGILCYLTNLLLGIQVVPFSYCKYSDSYVSMDVVPVFILFIFT